MADTTESNLQIVNQENGGNDGTWGDIADANFAKLVTAITETTTKTVTGGTTSLTDDEQRAAVLIFNGTLTSNQIIKVNDTAEKWWFVKNDTTGSYTLTVQTDTGTGIAVTQGDVKILRSDGTNVIDLTLFLAKTDLFDLGYVGTFTENGDENTLTASDTNFTGTLAAGHRISGKVTNANTSDMTLDYNSAGAASIVDGLGAEIQPGVVPAGGYLKLEFDGTNWVLLNVADPFKQNTAPKLYGPLDPNGNDVGWDKGSDIASASGPTVPTDGNFFVVTGTTGISSFTVSANRLFALYFSDAVTLTHSTNTLELPGNVDFTTRAGDRLLCFADATDNVVVLHVQRQDLIVNERKGADLASASTISPGDDGNFFDVTGTTTITAIATTGIIGTEITLQFDGVLTLTHHATDLILPTGLDITTQAGDTAIFREYASGDWVCISYLRADGTALAVNSAIASSVADVTISNGSTFTEVMSVDIAAGDFGSGDIYHFIVRGSVRSNNTTSADFRLKVGSVIWRDGLRSLAGDGNEQPWTLEFDLFCKDGVSTDAHINGTLIFAYTGAPPTGEGQSGADQVAVAIRGSVSDDVSAGVTVTLEINDNYGGGAGPTRTVDMYRVSKSLG